MVKTQSSAFHQKKKQKTLTLYNNGSIFLHPAPSILCNTRVVWAVRGLQILDG